MTAFLLFLTAMSILSLLGRSGALCDPEADNKPLVKANAVSDIVVLVWAVVLLAS